jgi:hypothetical protein
MANVPENAVASILTLLERLRAETMDLETLLRREAAAAALTEISLTTSPKTLSTLATRGGGPQFRKYGRYPVYRWGDCLDWAHSRLSAPMHSTSEADAPARRQ